VCWSRSRTCSGFILVTYLQWVNPVTYQQWVDPGHVPAVGWSRSRTCSGLIHVTYLQCVDPGHVPAVGLSWSRTCSGFIQVTYGSSRMSGPKLPIINRSVPHIRQMINTSGTNVNFRLASSITSRRVFFLVTIRIFFSDWTKTERQYIIWAYDSNSSILNYNCVFVLNKPLGHYSICILWSKRDCVLFYSSASVEGVCRTCLRRKILMVV